MPDLTPGQNKRLGRISESNPERAGKVAERMNNRASREERGAAIAKGARKEEGMAIRKSRMEEGMASASERKYSRADTPLAPTPEPLYGRNEPNTKNEKAREAREAALQFADKASNFVKKNK